MFSYSIDDSFILGKLFWVNGNMIPTNISVNLYDGKIVSIYLSAFLLTITLLFVHFSNFTLI